MKSKVIGPALSADAVQQGARWLGQKPRRALQGCGAILVAAGMAATSLTALGGATAAVAAPTPKYGGTLRLVGQGDVDFMDTANGYYDVTFGLDRAITRQLYGWPISPQFAKQVNPVPDLATAMPVMSNGNKTYTVTIRTGAMWDTSPPRQVTAQDEITGLKRLCNPASPAGALGYYEATIVGFQSYCSAFLATGSKKTGATVSANRSAPPRANAYVSAIGPKIWPSGPCMVKRGTKAQTIIAVVKKRARSTSRDAFRIRSLSDNSAYSPEERWR